MGNLFNKPEEPPPMVLVPPRFDFPPLSARTRMLESAYNTLFGKLLLKCLFEDYFEEAGHFSTRIMLKPIDDPNVDLIATIAGPLDHKPDEKITGNALFRWQRKVDDPNTFMDLFVSNSDPILRIRSSAYHPKYGFGAFGAFPLLLMKGTSSNPFGLVGLRYGSQNLSFGASATPFSSMDELPRIAWLVTRMGRVTAGVQYEPTYGKVNGAKYKNLMNWSCAIGYGVGSGSPLSPSFNFNMEFAKNSMFIASFYQHVVVQRRVKNPFEENDIVGITNYIDFGFELQTRVDEPKRSEDENQTESGHDSTFQVAASWQANKNLLLKGKIGPLSSSIAMAFKSWWKPSFTFTISATRDRITGTVAHGFGIRMENIREASYQRADPNFVMLTPNKEHLAEGMAWKIGNRPILIPGRNADDDLNWIRNLVLTTCTSLALSLSLLIADVDSASAFVVTTPRKLQSDELATVRLFQENTPSVVYITNLAVKQDAFTLDVLEVPQGSGSGFVWDQEGHIVTNYHVIRGASDLKVTLADQSTYDARVVGFDQDKDVAVLRVDAPKDKLRPIPIGVSADLLVGQKVYAIGNPVSVWKFFLNIPL
ncbi:hypothetical protein SAY86_002831 [Trapa natans]|uniref:Uncharacterized protein n=1 Tax=Trapa natans TaxID=22666 RepID=A0AAN7LUD9_TRANT|nr:hypothetical protein SAY86_002831 [Trapa natans]